MFKLMGKNFSLIKLVKESEKLRLLQTIHNQELNKI
jgi:hypothetical protein